MENLTHTILGANFNLLISTAQTYGLKPWLFETAVFVLADKPMMPSRTVDGESVFCQPWISEEEATGGHCKVRDVFKRISGSEATLETLTKQRQFYSQFYCNADPESWWEDHLDATRDLRIHRYLENAYPGPLINPWVDTDIAAAANRILLPHLYTGLAQTVRASVL